MRSNGIPGMIRRVLVFCLILLAFSLFPGKGLNRVYAEESLDFDLPMNLKIQGETEATPSPGGAVFHFNIWSDTGVPLTIKDNSVQADGFGIAFKRLSFSVSSAEDAQKIKTGAIHVRQYDGNPDWKFDMTELTYNWYDDYRCFDVIWPGTIFPKPMTEFWNLCNTYAPQAGTPSGATVVTVPVEVTVTKASEAVPDPGPAVFHFGITSSSGAAITVINNAVSTSGTGTFTGSISFSVPAEQFGALTESGFTVQQLEGNPDWVFDTYAYWMFYDSVTGDFSTWLKYFRASTKTVSVSNVYSPASSGPAPTEPAPTDPAPTPTAPAPAGEEGISIEEDTEKAVFTLPVIVDVVKTGEQDVPGAVFHFGLDCMKADQQYTWINDVVYTGGEGEYSGSVSFSVPAGEELDKLIETGFDLYQRHAVVVGWSFAGEVYHVTLSREGGALKAEITRHRRVTTAEAGKNVLYYRDYFGKDSGGLQSGNTPASMIGIKDLFGQAFAVENATYLGMFEIYTGETVNGIKSVNYKLHKSGEEFGNADISFNWQGKTAEVEDAFRLTEDGLFIRLKSLAQAWEQATGEKFFMANEIPDAEWVSFRQEDISWLDFQALGELFSRFLRDQERALDEFPATKTHQGYRIDADADDWESFRYLVLDEAQLNHEIWYKLAMEAAKSENVKGVADALEAAFNDFCDKEMNNAGLMEILTEKYPLSVDKLEASFDQIAEKAFTVGSEAAISNVEGARKVSFTLSVTEDVVPEELPGTPENAVSGGTFLFDLLMELKGSLDNAE